MAETSQEWNLPENISEWILALELYKVINDPSILCDLVINIGGKVLNAHKIVLIAKSPAFMKMLLTDDVMESNSITIEDVDSVIFEYFLNYLYSGKIGAKSFAEMKSLHSLADKYEVVAFKHECGRKLCSYLTVDTVCEIIKLAYTYDDSVMKERAKCFAADHIQEIVVKYEWKELVASDPVIGDEVMVLVNSMNVKKYQNN